MEKLRTLDDKLADMEEILDKVFPAALWKDEKAIKLMIKVLECKLTILGIKKGK